MGEVYRARDTKLKRDVAIKILPDEFSSDPDRVTRFQREAELLASLNHPSIAASYDLEEADSQCFLILELVDGETLSERLNRGPIPLNDALQLASQIAEALASAHKRGIIHRDLKELCDQRIGFQLTCWCMSCRQDPVLRFGPYLRTGNRQSR